mmetsp:Transcript_3781/g.23865  ORF Transcript_3781/g.23865 Transcript_3781/m.23865 type:complete len:266 (+) Transcript_3781:3010-3807(+)
MIEGGCPMGFQFDSCVSERLFHGLFHAHIFDGSFSVRVHFFCAQFSCHFREDLFRFANPDVQFPSTFSHGLSQVLHALQQERGTVGSVSIASGRLACFVFSWIEAEDACDGSACFGCGLECCVIVQSQVGSEPDQSTPFRCSSHASFRSQQIRKHRRPFIRRRLGFRLVLHVVVRGCVDGCGFHHGIFPPRLSRFFPSICLGWTCLAVPRSFRRGPPPFRLHESCVHACQTMRFTDTPSSTSHLLECVSNPSASDDHCRRDFRTS